MKNINKLTVITLFCICIIGCQSNNRNQSSGIDDRITIEVNPAIELISTIHYLAGTDQYDERLLPAYLSEVDSYFDQWKDHPAVIFAKEINQQHQINGSAPMALAVYLGPPPLLEPKADLSKPSKDLDPRWDSTLITDYLKNAKEFAIESKFLNFYDKKKEFHDRAINNLKKTLADEHILHWFNEFFGYQPDNFKMYIGLINGSCNYGFPVTDQAGKQEFVSLLGARWPDKNGAPTYRKDWFMPVVIHEYCHSYINPLFQSRPDEFKELGESLLDTHREKMLEHGYNVWNVILNEYLVRACTIRFLEENEGSRKARERIQWDTREGFSAIGGLVDLLNEYEANRSKYPDIESFLPQIIKYFEITTHIQINEK